MGKFEKANDLAILAGARRPQWAQQVAYDGAPSSASSGVYMEDAISSVLSVEMREEAHRRTARVTVSVVDLAADYTVTINGTACTALGPFVDAEQIITDLVMAINASAEAPVVTASAVDTDDDTIDDTVKIVGDIELHFTIDISATGTGVLACVADPDTAGLRIFATYRKSGSSSAPAAWTLVYDQDFPLDYRGFSERPTVAAVDRLYAELYDVDGTGDGASVTYAPTVMHGPCVTE